jgi:hypothetical protein
MKTFQRAPSNITETGQNITEIGLIGKTHKRKVVFVE